MPTIQDMIYKILNRESEAFRLMGMDQQGEFVNKVIEVLCKDFDTDLIVATATDVLESANKN